MAFKPIKTNFKDAVWNGLRKYNEVNNPDGTKSFEDVTVYTFKEDSLFGAKEANAIAEAVNTIMHMVENGTDLYTAFQTYFDTQKQEFETQSNLVFQEYEQGYDQRIRNFETQKTNEYNRWFETIQTSLDGNVAGNLQNQITTNLGKINTLSGRVTDAEDSLLTTNKKVTAIETKLKNALFLR